MKRQKRLGMSRRGARDARRFMAMLAVAGLTFAARPSAGATLFALESSSLNPASGLYGHSIVASLDPSTLGLTGQLDVTQATNLIGSVFGLAVGDGSIYTSISAPGFGSVVTRFDAATLSDVSVQLLPGTVTDLTFDEASHSLFAFESSSLNPASGLYGHSIVASLDPSTLGLTGQLDVTQATNLIGSVFGLAVGDGSIYTSISAPGFGSVITRFDAATLSDVSVQLLPGTVTDLTFDEASHSLFAFESSSLNPVSGIYGHSIVASLDPSTLGLTGQLDVTQATNLIGSVFGLAVGDGSIYTSISAPGFGSVVTRFDAATLSDVSVQLLPGMVTDLIFEADVAAPVPEPSSWAQMVFGFGLLGSLLRSLRSRTAVYPRRASCSVRL